MVWKRNFPSSTESGLMRGHFVVGVSNPLGGGCSGREGVWMNEPRWHLYRLSANYHQSGNKPPISGHEYLVRLGECKFRRGDTGGSKAKIFVIDSVVWYEHHQYKCPDLSIEGGSNEDRYGRYQSVGRPVVSENLDKRACVVRGSSCGSLEVRLTGYPFEDAICDFPNIAEEISPPRLSKVSEVHLRGK